MVSKLKGDRIRIAMLAISEAVAQSTKHGWENRGYHTFQDDIRVVGFELYVSMTHAVDTPALQEGELWHSIVLARGGVTDQQSWIAQVTAALHYYTEIVVAQQIAVMHGNLTNHLPVMFPAGIGLDFDEGDAIYLHNTVSAMGISADTMDATGVAYIYTVER